MLTRLALFRLERSITAHMKKVRTIVVTSLITTSSLLYAEDPKPEAAPAPEKKETDYFSANLQPANEAYNARDYKKTLKLLKKASKTPKFREQDKLYLLEEQY